ncbi:MAG: hypothetical protein IKP72_17220 [Clostridia bacterium]|nr:hypothetical protein [Clostridia bacterium]
MSRNSSGGSAVLFVLVIAAAAAVINFMRDYWIIIAAVAAVLLILLIVSARKKAKARAEYLAQPILYIGNSGTKTFHCLSCRQANGITDRNKVAFRSREEATSTGYSPCGICRP